jgi:hypothetical protein
MALNLGKAVVDFLTAHPEEKFSARQIAEWLGATFPGECKANCGNCAGGNCRLSRGK